MSFDLLPRSNFFPLKTWTFVDIIRCSLQWPLEITTGNGETVHSQKKRSGKRNFDIVGHRIRDCIIDGNKARTPASLRLFLHQRDCSLLGRHYYSQSTSLESKFTRILQELPVVRRVAWSMMMACVRPGVRGHPEWENVREISRGHNVPGDDAAKIYRRRRKSIARCCNFHLRSAIIENVMPLIVLDSWTSKPT